MITAGMSNANKHKEDSITQYMTCLECGTSAEKYKKIDLFGKEFQNGQAFQFWCTGCKTNRGVCTACGHQQNLTGTFHHKTMARHYAGSECQGKASNDSERAPFVSPEAAVNSRARTRNNAKQCENGTEINKNIHEQVGVKAEALETTSNLEGAETNPKGPDIVLPPGLAECLPINDRLGSLVKCQKCNLPAQHYQEIKLWGTNLLGKSLRLSCGNMECHETWAICITCNCKRVPGGYHRAMEKHFRSKRHQDTLRQHYRLKKRRALPTRKSFYESDEEGSEEEDERYCETSFFGVDETDSSDDEEGEFAAAAKRTRLD